MKRFIGLLMLVVCLNAYGQKQISHIETTGAWYYVYDTNGKRIKTLSRNGMGELKGWGTTFFIVKRSGFYLICDPEGMTIKTLGAQSVGEILSASGETFTSRLGNWIYTWDKNGKRINTRYAH